MPLNQNIPLFFRLYHKIKHDILKGEILKGSKIATIEELARQHGMSQTSVRKSLDLLEREGLLIKKQGWGTVVPENLDLRFFDLATLISSRESISEAKMAKAESISSEWVETTPRLRGLLNIKDAASNQVVLKVYCRITFTGKWKFKAFISYYLPKRWMRIAKVKESTSAAALIVSITKWMESSPLLMKESLVPYLCTDETAEFLDIPDGTPVFYHTVSMTDNKRDLCICWDMISSANIFLRNVDLNAAVSNSPLHSPIVSK
ncbi:MAG: GntR family transcriptional regulator [Desulfobacterales bacterium]|nr:GntR family transcriptional regulator [Desulfobacterales bacterium]